MTSSSPRVLLVSSFGPASSVLSRLLHGATWEAKKPLVALSSTPEADLVVLDVPLQVSVALADRMLGWTREVSARTPVMVLREKESAFPASVEASTTTKPVRGARLRELAERLVPRSWTRDPSLDLVEEERLACAWWTAERCGLSARELALVAAAIAESDRDAMAARLRLGRRTVDEYAARVRARSALPLEELAKKAWEAWGKGS